MSNHSPTGPHKLVGNAVGIGKRLQSSEHSADKLNQVSVTVKVTVILIRKSMGMKCNTQLQTDDMNLESAAMLQLQMLLLE